MVLTGHTDVVNSVAWSPDGGHLATGSCDATVRLWDAFTGMEQAVLTGHRDLVGNVVWHPDSRRVASHSWDRTVRIWDTTTGHGERLLPNAGVGGAMAYSPDGKRLFAGRLDVTENAAPRSFGSAPRIRAISFSPDGSRYVAGTSGHTAAVFDSDTGEELLTLDHGSAWYSTVAWRPDGATIATGSFDHAIRLFDATTGELNQVIRHTESISRIVWCPDGSRLAVCVDGDETHIIHLT